MKSLIWIILGAGIVAAGFYGWQMTSNDASDANGASAQAQRGGGAPGGRRGGGGRPPPLVVASEVSEALINDRLKALGSGSAQASVSVVPLSGGILTDVLVTSGQRVEAGEILARIDAEEQQIARDRAARAATEAESDVARLRQLMRTSTATQVELDRARAALTDAQLALRDAELRLSRLTITAPIAGVVGFVSVDSGNFIDAQTELLTIDDRAGIAVEFWVPERFANQIALDQSISAVALADPGKVYEGQISGIGSRIEPASRTLRVKALIDNQDDRLRPGMSFEMQLAFPGESYAAVDPLSIQWDSNGSFVWKLNDDKVERVAARIVQRNPENVLVDSELSIGDLVIKEGLLSLRQGATVRVEGAAARGSGAQSDSSNEGRPNTQESSTGKPNAQASNTDRSNAQRPGTKAPNGTGEGKPTAGTEPSAASNTASGS